MGNIEVMQLGCMQCSHVTQFYTWEGGGGTFRFPMHTVHTYMSRLTLNIELDGYQFVWRKHLTLGYWADKEMSNMRCLKLISIQLFSHLLSTCQCINFNLWMKYIQQPFRPLCNHHRDLSPWYEASLRCDLQPAECEPASMLSREFQTAFPTGNKCSRLWQTRMIRVARQHVPNHHAAKIPHYNARSFLEYTP